MTCVLDGCDRKVDPRWCVCSEHWRTLPDDLRTELSRAYDQHQPITEQSSWFFRTRAKVQSWIRKTFGAEEARAKPSWDQLVAWVRERDAARGLSTPPRSGAVEPDRPEPGPLGQMRLLP